MAEKITNYRIGSCSVDFGGTNLGYTGEDTSVTIGLELADITMDKYGSTLVSQVKMGRSAEASMTLKQNSPDDLADIWKSVFADYDVAKSGANSMVLNGEAGEDLRALAKTLILHPRDKAPGDFSDDFTLNLAVPVEVGEISLNNEGQRVLPVTFRGYVEEAKGLFTYGY